MMDASGTDGSAACGRRRDPTGNADGGGLTEPKTRLRRDLMENPAEPDGDGWVSTVPSDLTPVVHRGPTTGLRRTSGEAGQARGSPRSWCPPTAPGFNVPRTTGGRSQAHRTTGEVRVGQDVRVPSDARYSERWTAAGRSRKPPDTENGIRQAAAEWARHKTASTVAAQTMPEERTVFGKPLSVI